MRVGIALGSNLGDRLQHLQDARAAIRCIAGIEGEIHSSPVYETEPVDCAPGTPGFLNAAILAEFNGHPIALLDSLQEIEAALGRPDKRPRNAPRPIDLDVLFAGNMVLTNEELIIPHPRLHTRRFVLQPLADLDDTLLLPGCSRTVGELLRDVKDPTSVVKIHETW